MSRHLDYAEAERDIFLDSTIDEIFSFSGGAARLINKACTHCLIYGAQNARRIIDDHMVRLVVSGKLAKERCVNSRENPLRFSLLSISWRSA